MICGLKTKDCWDRVFILFTLKHDIFTSVVSHISHFTSLFFPLQSLQNQWANREMLLKTQFIMILKFQAVIKMADIVFSVRLNPLSLHLVKCVFLSWLKQRSREGQCDSDLSISSNTLAGFWPTNDCAVCVFLHINFPPLTAACR